MKQLNAKVKSAQASLPWLAIALTMLWLISLALRFWGLSRFNKLVFDEIYFVKYARNYLTHTSFFDVHPPLGKYLIAIGIWIANRFQPLGVDSQISAFSYRWMNALMGSFIPLVVGAIAYQLTYRRSYAFMATLFALTDGLLLVESRYGLLSVYLVLFGLLGQWFFLLALTRDRRQRQWWLLFAGIAFGASVSVKWYGLGCLLGAYLLWMLAWMGKWGGLPLDLETSQPETRKSYFWENLTRLKFLPFLFYLGIIPMVVYLLIWIPHLQIDPSRGLWQWHRESLAFHEQLGTGSNTHPYCSPWYSWVLAIRPVGYLYETLNPSGRSPIVYDVHGMGNPILWWLSAIAIASLLGILLKRLFSSFRHPSSKIALPEIWLSLYLLSNYGANWLPWAMVTRCAFIYYYLGAVVFAFLAIAYFVDRWLVSPDRWLRGTAVTCIFLSLFGFLYWLPIYLGLPLSSEAFHSRMWFLSWY